MHMTEIDKGDLVIRIRPVRPTDTPRLLEMIAALAAHHGDAATASARTLNRDLFGPSACARVLVADRAGALLGYSLIGVYPHLHFGRRVMELHHLFVDDTARGAGVGRHLVAAAVEEARRQECNHLVVATHPDNQRAQRIYASLGFQPQASGGPRFRLDLPPSGALPAGWV